MSCLAVRLSDVFFAFSGGRREYEQKIRVIIPMQFIINSAVMVLAVC